MRKPCQVWLPILLMCLATVTANAQSFRVQCPTSTGLHPSVATVEPAYSGPGGVNGAIKCQQISGGDGYATMGDGSQTYLFSFGPLSGVRTSPNGLSTGERSLHPRSTLPTIPSARRMGGWLDARRPKRARSQCRSALDHGSRRMNGNIPAPLMSIDEDDEFFPPQTWDDHAAWIRAAHGSLHAECVAADGVPTHSGDQHRRQLHVLLPAPDAGIFLALPHHAAGTLADGHGRTATSGRGKIEFPAISTAPLKPTGGDPRTRVIR